MASSGNFCTMNPDAQNGGSDNTSKIFELGNLQVRNFQYFDASVMGNFGVRSGKWYYEATYKDSAGGSGPAWGWCNAFFNIDAGLSYTVPSSQTGGDTIHIYGVGDSGTIRVTSGVHNESGSNWANTSISAASGQICGIAVDFDNSKAYFSINGSFTSVRSGQDPANGTNPCLAPSGGLYTWNLTADNLAKYGPWYPAIGNWAAASRTVRVNFGQDSTFNGQVAAGGFQDANGFGDFKYQPPDGFLALCSANLPASTNIDPAQTSTNYSSKLFKAITYTGNGSTNNVTGVGFKPDLVWLKRTDTSASHQLYDSSRGTGKLLSCNTSDAQQTVSTGLNSFNTDGFTLGSAGGANANSGTFVAWCWKANGGTTTTNNDGSTSSTVQASTEGGFSIITYTGNGSVRTIGHGLGARPEFMIIKNTATTDNWVVYHRFTGASNRAQLNTGNYGSSSGSFNSTEPTDSVITLGTSSGTNANGNLYVCYAWAPVVGLSSFGAYVGNAASSGPYVACGTRPEFVIVRRALENGSFNSFDSGRFPNNPASSYISLTDTDGALTGNSMDIFGQGFKLRGSTGSGINKDDTPMYYAVWGNQANKYSNAQ